MLHIAVDRSLELSDCCDPTPAPYAHEPVPLASRLGPKLWVRTTRAGYQPPFNANHLVGGVGASSVLTIGNLGYAEKGSATTLRWITAVLPTIGGRRASSSAFEASKDPRRFSMIRIDRTGIAPLGCLPAATSRMIEAWGR